jgi:hypothetical protein
MAASSAALRADRVSSVVVGPTWITIVVPVEVVGGSSRLVAAWRDAIDRAWNRGRDGGPFTVCGREVRFDARITARSGLEDTPSPSSHLVLVADVIPGQRYVSSVWHAPGTRPTESARKGFWGNDLTPAKAAHEFGHLLGLLDEYTEEDANANGLRDPGEGSVPDVARFPDAWASLMAYEGGAVLERHVREVLRLHGAGDALACEP